MGDNGFSSGFAASGFATSGFAGADTTGLFAGSRMLLRAVDFEAGLDVVTWETRFTVLDDEVVLVGFVGGGTTFSVFFSAAAFSRIFARMLFGLLSPKVELDAIFFNVDDTAYFEWDGGGFVAELTLAALGFDFCLISAILALRASEAAACAFFFSSSFAVPAPPNFILKADPPGEVFARVDDIFVFCTLDCNALLWVVGLETTAELFDDSIDESDTFDGINCLGASRSSFAKLLGTGLAAGFASSR
mmetsp:Transcript_37029/g.66648  ORF Transcript_37029/g.66648 Transcript_37029/m.66648 type:complete len:247 (-) Transcript_37029:1031-1771(-)